MHGMASKSCQMGLIHYIVVKNMDSLGSGYKIKPSLN